VPVESRELGCLFSDDPARLDLDAVHGFLRSAYWSRGIPRALVERAAANSMVFGVYDESAPGAPQVGYARVITDKATFAYLCDVFVLPLHRGRGLSRALMRVILAHPDLQGLRRFCLLTRDAHGVYTPFGFSPMQDPSRYLEIARPNLYEGGGPAREADTGS
jgi:N-acetylglutamate synthase-like GNAT family acetyltransferase